MEILYRATLGILLDMELPFLWWLEFSLKFYLVDTKFCDFTF